MSISYIPMNNEYKKLTPFKRYVLQSFPWINENFDALTNYELLAKIIEYLNNVITSQNGLIENTEIIENNVQYLYEYLQNLDLQDEVNNKLDEMVEDGTLQEIIASYLNAQAVWGFDNVASMKDATNLINGSYAKTLGYYAKNDGGCGLYKIRNRTFDDVVDEGKIILMTDETLVAELIIINSTVVPEQFGAYGNGTSDDSTAINNAILSLKENGGTVHLNAKTYAIAHTIILHSLVNIEGEGNESSIIKLKDNSNCDVMKSYNFTDEEAILYTMTTKNILEAKDYMLLDVTLKDFQIDGNRMNVNTGTINNNFGYGIKMNPYGFHSSGVLVRNCPQVGVYIENTRVALNWTNEPNNNDITINSYWAFDIHGCGEEGIIIRGLPDTTCYHLIVQNCNANENMSTIYANDTAKGSVVIDHTSWHRGTLNLGDVHIAGSPCYGLVTKGGNRIKGEMLMIEGSHGGWYADQSTAYHQISKLDFHNLNDEDMYMLYGNVAYMQISSMEVRNGIEYASKGIFLGGICKVNALYRDLYTTSKTSTDDIFTLDCYNSELVLNVSNVGSGYAVKTTSNFASNYLDLKTYLCTKDFDNATMGRRNQIKLNAYKTGTIVKDNIMTVRNLADSTWYRNILLNLEITTYNDYVGLFPCNKYLGSSFKFDRTSTSEQTLTSSSNPFFVYASNLNFVKPHYNSKCVFDYIKVTEWNDDDVKVIGKISSANGESTDPIITLEANNLSQS